MYSIKVNSSVKKSYKSKQGLFMYSMKLNPLFTAILESKKIRESQKSKYFSNNKLSKIKFNFDLI